MSTKYGEYGIDKTLTDRRRTELMGTSLEHKHSLGGA